MIKSRAFFILLAGMFISSPAVHADDVCDTRPDLCGRPARVTKGQIKKKKKKKIRRCKDCNNETARLADEMEAEMIEEQRNKPVRRHRNLDRKTQSSFDAYMNANATNPSLKGRIPAAQTAFQPHAPARNSPAQNRPDPTVTATPFASGAGPNAENGGFSSPPVTLGQPASEPAPGPVSPAPETEEKTPLH